MLQDKNLERREIELLRMRREILAEPPEKALDMILSSKLPAQLVQSFSDQDLYFLSHDIGIADALPVLALATSEQWGYMLDVEIWHGDRLDMDAVTRWLRVLLIADGRRLVRWLMAERLEFMELYLFRNIEVIIREKNEDPSDFPDGYFTVDDYFYVRIKEKPEVIPERGDDEMIRQDDLDLVVRELIDKIMDIDHGLYQSILLEAMGVIPSEVEEEDFRLRNVRLAEKGFLPLDEALEVYSPIHEDQMKEQVITRKSTQASDDDTASYPLAHIREIRGANRFTEALAQIENWSDPGEFQMEFAALCNQIISADQTIIRERETLAKVVKKVSAFISLGLEILENHDNKDQPGLQPTRPDLIMKHSLKNIFKLGYGRIIDLRNQALKLSRDSWFIRQKLPLSFWGETFFGILGGLLVKRPVFYEQKSAGSPYRDFESLKDVHDTAAALEDIRGFDELFSMISPRLDDFKGYFLTYSNMILTLWVHGETDRDEKTEGPVTLSVFRSFFDGLWEPGERTIEKGGSISQTRKTDFLVFLCRRSGFNEEEISSRMGRALERLFGEIEKEYGAISVKDLDPRYVTHFCIRKG